MKHYLSHTLQQVLDAGDDLLARELLASGPPTFERVKGVLPEINSGRYLCLAGPITWQGLTVDTRGWVYAQEPAVVQVPHPTAQPLFTPMEVESDADRAATTQTLLDGWIPVVTTHLDFGERQTHITCFVQFGDPDVSPQLWIEVRHSDRARHCYVADRSRYVAKRAITPEQFDDELATTAAEWRAFAAGHDFTLPHHEVRNAALAAAANVVNTFSGDHAHYGHRFYGREIGDFFPPNYLYGAELCMTLGMTERAWGMLSHLLRFGIDIRGRFNYWQGLKDTRAASASEYGRLFWLLRRAHLADPVASPLACHAAVLLRMASHLLANVATDPASGRELVLMCAEADTRARVNAYASNNLWAVAGLRDLARLLDLLNLPAEAASISASAETLWQNIRAALDAAAVPTPGGPLVPFRLGYPALPLTLSRCLHVPGGTPPADYYEWRNHEDPDSGHGQDLTENTYANYRYYAEMLSSGLLRPDEARAIVALRETRGGELLGMTRLQSWLDDWPADNYARHYLENDYLDKFHLLYHAHTLHHGNPETGVYYEQVTADGRVCAVDCIPATALTPLMTAWMFCFQPAREDAVYLLRGIPADWHTLGKEFSARGLLTSAGRFSIRVNPSTPFVEIEAALNPCVFPVYIDLPTTDLFRIAADGARLEPTSRPRRYRLHLEQKRVIIQWQIPTSPNP